VGAYFNRVSCQSLCLLATGLSTRGSLNAAPEALLTSEGTTFWLCLPSNKGRPRALPNRSWLMSFEEVASAISQGHCA
jgi:hypothetical protein